MKNNTTETLFKMKKEIETSKLNLARLEGELSAKLERLKTDFNCSNLAEAKRKLEKMNIDIDKEETSLKSAISRIKEEYNWE